jgi:hypothetical protein
MNINTKPILEGTITDNSQLSEYNLKIKCLMEPSNDYFSNVENDRREYDRLILFNGLEPFEINNIRTNIIDHHHYFDKIYTYDEEIIEKCPNAEKWAFGSCWVLTDSTGNQIDKDEEFGDFYKTDDKKFKLSFIRSHKNQLTGHQMRHHIPNLLNDQKFEIFFPQSRIDTKHPLFIDSMFHIAVENSKHNNYFTEKIIDCFMSKTIPIYWGCPNIGEYFDTDGMILFDNLEELNKYFSSISPDFFNERLNIIEDNYKRAKEYALFNKRLDKLIHKSL